MVVFGRGECSGADARGGKCPDTVAYRGADWVVSAGVQRRQPSTSSAATAAVSDVVARCHRQYLVVRLPTIHTTRVAHAIHDNNTQLGLVSR